MAASNYTINAILNHLLRGINMNVPQYLYVSLHTANPGRGGGNEVTTSKWPAYVRRDANNGESFLLSAFNPPSQGKVKNVKQILWPPYNGTGTITLTHLGIWTMPTGGDFLMSGALASAKTLSPSDEIVIHGNALTVEVN